MSHLLIIKLHTLPTAMFEKRFNIQSYEAKPYPPYEEAKHEPVLALDKGIRLVAQ